jgi:hypothetical protein
MEVEDEKNFGYVCIFTDQLLHTYVHSAICESTRGVRQAIIRFKKDCAENCKNRARKCKIAGARIIT